MARIHRVIESSVPGSSRVSLREWRPRRLLVSLWILALAAGLVGCAPEPAPEPAAEGETDQEQASQDPLTVCMYPGFAPFTSVVSGEWVGWDVAFLQHFAASQDRDFTPVTEEEFKNIWQKPGQPGPPCEIAASGISDSETRRDDSPGTLWTEHYFAVERAFAVRTEARDQELGCPHQLLDDIQDLVGTAVIVTQGSTADLDLQHRAQAAGLPIELSCDEAIPGSLCVGYTDNEEEAAEKVATSCDVFAYGGGDGSIECLAMKLAPGLEEAWRHGYMNEDGMEVDEPFSFVVTAEDPDLFAALNDFIDANKDSYKTEPPPGCNPPTG
jgi:hypothetical protein